MTMTKMPNGTMQEDTTAPPAAIVRAPQTDDRFRFALEPEGFREAQTMCAIIAKAGVCGIKSPEEAMIRLLAGRELGIPTMIALQNVYDVYGRPSLSAKLKVALCLRHPECEYFEHVSSDEKQATYKAKRRGRDEQKRTFKIEQAVTAQLVKKDSNWEKWPHRMLQARAAGELADLVFPDACMGMPSVEEAYDAGPPARPARAYDEMTGEVIEQTQAPAQAAPTRDLESEAALLKHRISTLMPAMTDADKKTLRADVGAFIESAGEPYAQEMKKFYNAALAEAKKKPAAAAPPPATTAAPGDDLFGPQR
jgi:hypothetical protein